MYIAFKKSGSSGSTEGRHTDRSTKDMGSAAEGLLEGLKPSESAEGRAGFDAWELIMDK